MRMHMVAGGVLVPLLALVGAAAAQYAATATTTAVPTAALTSATAVGAGGGAPPAPAGGSNIACPAVSFAQRVDPIGGGVYRVVWTADKAADASKTLQSIASVDLHYRVNQVRRTARAAARPLHSHVHARMRVRRRRW